MKGGSNNYISLQEATKFCNYSQEYLSLRARQGRLKAVKFGRNWVTKKEWLDEYLKKVEEYNNNLVNKKLPTKKVVTPPANLPIEKIPVLRFGFVVALVFVLLIAGITFGKTSFQNVYNTASPLVKEFNENFDRGLAEVAQEANDSTYLVSTAGDIIVEEIGKSITESFTNVGYQSADIGGLFQEYSQWLASQTSELGERIVQGYITANNFVEEKLLALRDRISEGYFVANDFVEKKLTQGYQALTKPFVRAFQFVISPWRITLPEKIPVEKISKEDFESLQKEVKQLKEEGIPAKEIIKEVTKVTQVQPVKEITKEKIITKIDEKALKQVRADIVELQSEVAKRLYAPGGVVTQQIYITEPVASPKIYQENGDIVLQTAGSGNVILSAATGMQISGSQVVIDSTSALNPLVYIADKTRIDGNAEVNGTFSAGGPITAQRIALNAPSSYTGKILDVQRAGTTKFSVDYTGAATLVGNFTITGQLVQTGTSTISGILSISTSSESTVLTVTQSGTGNIVEFKDSGTTVFVISDGGTATLAGDFLPATTTTYDLGSETYHWQDIYATSLQAVELDLTIQTATTGNIYILPQPALLRLPPVLI
jgi:hypothetical protein